MCKCSVCKKDFNYLQEGDQVVLKVETSTDWNGELAFLCGDCLTEHKKGTLKSKVEKLSQIFELSEKKTHEDAKNEIWKKKYGEGQRWVQEEKYRNDTKRIAAERGVTYQSLVQKPNVV